MQEYLPYIVSIACSLIAGVTSYLVSHKETKSELQKLMKQHELDLDTEREKHRHELELQELNHKHQLELLQKEFENKLGADVVSTVMSEVIKTPEVRRQISQGMASSGKKNAAKRCDYDQF